ncbi:hypothetical protein [Mesorhizobium sp. B2-8-5]|uniref:hypothetical protein n=1 Tax=Mesorhizobium sp. B2-8-5 TaxID=2589903 RepID=UPI00112ECA17|nr:hypothetical protein [Mesorhizobium sp. B2-8-5]UCI25335.1 hypothetical protein FJ430_27825 [Mesorhizobium sp. B2-8-5]
MQLFAGGFTKIFHFHLKKCSGTSLNSWLNWQQPDDRLWDEAEVLKLLRRVELFNQPIKSAALTAFSTSYAFGTHLPIRAFAADDVFCCTVLRDPRQRILSQIADWRREARVTSHYIGSPEDDALRDSVQLSLTSFLKKHSRSGVRFLLDNYMTRALAAGYTAEIVEEMEDVASLLPIALRALERRYHVVGLSSRLSETKAAIASSLGLVHDVGQEVALNVTESSRLFAYEVDEDANRLLERFTAHDQVLYNRANELFEERHSITAARYNETEFETYHSPLATKRLRPFARDGFSVVSVKDTILGSGHWGRDAAGTAQCCVWTGPHTRTVLYLPCPADVDLSIRVWIRGYAAAHLRRQLRFEIDDVARTHSFQHAEGWLETATIQARSKRAFLKIAMLVDETVADTAIGEDRRRGVAFDSYGWAINSSSLL